MRKGIVSYTLLFILVVSLISTGIVFGNNTGANERNQLNQVQNEIDKAEKEYEQGKKEEKNLLDQIKSLEGQMLSTQAEIDAIKGDINVTESKIANAQARLDDLEAQLDEQNENLSARLRAMYMSGNISVLDVLLGSSSISDFMTNMDRIQMIYESDREVIESLEEQHLIMDTHRQYMLDLQAQLETEKEKEAVKNEALKQNQKVIAGKKTEVSENNKLLSQYIDALNAEANRLIAEILAMQSDADYVGGDMLWPVPGAKRVTSEFGYRIHPILKYGKQHTGIDIAAPTGTNVVAANGGRVMKAGWNDSYGYLVMLDHGGGIVTLYAHNSSILVNEGDFVGRGQVISKVGSTGMATGPHLHFEVRVNGEYKDPRGYL